MHDDIKDFNERQDLEYKAICSELASIICEHLPEAENKIWHGHPVWFLEGNPTVGYSKLKAGIRLMFWSGSSFDEEKLKSGTGKFKDASIIFTGADQIEKTDIMRWLNKSRDIQWDYKNIYKRKGHLIRIK